MSTSRDRVRLEGFYAEVAAGSSAEASERAAEAAAGLGIDADVDVVGEVEPGLWGVDLPGAEGPPAEAWTLARALAALPDVAYAEPLFEVPVVEPPEVLESAGADASPPADRAWAPRMVGADRAWAAGVTGRGVLVGHPDTGYTRHPEVWADGPTNRVQVGLGRDYVDDDADALDPQVAGATRQPGHGTATAGTLMSSPTGEVHGVAPGASIVPLRVSTSVVLLFTQRRLARAVRRAVDADCRVISISMGGVPSRRLERELRRAAAAGVIVVAAAGNQVRVVVWPAAYPTTIAAAACDWSGELWDGSSRGAAVDITAPGHGVWAPVWEDGEAKVLARSGTSYATAITAGAAALWLDRHGPDDLLRRYGGRTLDAFRAVLRASTTRPVGGARGGYGAGILDIPALLAEPLPTLAEEGVGDAPLTDALDDLLGWVPRDVEAPTAAAALQDAVGLDAVALALLAPELRFALLTRPGALDAFEAATRGEVEGLLDALGPVSPVLAEALASAAGTPEPPDPRGPAPVARTIDVPWGGDVHVTVKIDIELDL